MPDIATAATATLAQTIAAGSKVLGYYLGSGSVKVDVLFDLGFFAIKDAGGNLGVGTASPTKRLEAWGAGTAAALRLRETASYNVSWDINVGAANEMQFRHNAASSLDYIFRNGRMCMIDDFSFGVRWSIDVGAANEMRFGNNAGGPLDYVFNNGNLRAGTDNNRTLGSASYRWSVVYAGTGTINTSDARQKTWRGSPSTAELSAARRIAAELGFYQWNNAIAEKGADGARYHFGVRAQQVWGIMADEGLVEPIDANGKPGATPYAFLCYDEYTAEAKEAERRGEDGELLESARPSRAAGDCFGLRIDELTLFLIAAQEARIAALEAAG